MLKNKKFSKVRCEKTLAKFSKMDTIVDESFIFILALLCGFKDLVFTLY
jgi:hypothetical protein